ncbi:MAG: peptidoglycan DD-metalloendopeptidase family protein [Deltaproteobacteria bacterium]|nr:peptidoglycan DD-metalloendopeptidase family protein [Deltaproteobacteria bacterium]
MHRKESQTQSTCLKVVLSISGVLRKCIAPKSLSWILLAAAGILLVLSTGEIFSEPSKEFGIITSPRLNMRLEPGTHRPPIKILRKGTRVEILEQLDGWIKIKHEGTIGFIRNRASYVQIINEPATRPGEDDIQQFKKEAEDIGRKIEKSRSEVLAITQAEISTINSLNEIDLTLNKTRKRVLRIESELADLEKKIEASAHLSETLKEKIKLNENYAAIRLVALYKLNWLGTLNLLASADSIQDIILRKNALERVLAHDENVRKNLVENKARLETLLAQQKVQKTEKHALETALNAQIKIMAGEKSKRSTLLVDIRSKRSLELAAIESYKQAAITLDQKIKSLNVKLDQTSPAAKNTAGAPQKPFSTLKGLLNMPVSGKIVSFFGPYKNPKFNATNFRSGIDIKADRGEPIHAVSTGKTIYSSWFKGYGNMIIIDHGDSYYTVYAHVEELFKNKGDTVDSGEVIATVGDSGSMHGPRLYFEIRHHGQPINPLKWIKAG